MKLQVGKTYVTRDGLLTGHVDAIGFGGVATVTYSNGEQYVINGNGRVYESQEHAYDLIAESEPPAESTSRGGDVVGELRGAAATLRHVLTVVGHSNRTRAAAGIQIADDLDAIASRLAQQPVVGRDILREATNALEDLGAHDIARDLRAFAQQGGTKPNDSFAFTRGSYWRSKAIERESALRAYLFAQRRMRDKRADGDENVKRDLWRELHACEDAAAAALGDAEPQQPTPTADRVSVPREAIADRVVQSVCEMDDRSSPEDQPEMMLVTGAELHAFIIAAFDDLTPAPSPAGESRAVVLPDVWQPIETAPKNRTVLVGYRNQLGKWRTVRATYYTELEPHPDTDLDEPCSPGWYEEYEADDRPIYRCDCEPTHWQPLPPPPTTGDAREGQS